MMMRQATDCAKLDHWGMNTLISHQVYGRNPDHALQAVQKEVSRLERLLSRFLPSSDISRINRAAGSKQVPVHKDTVAVLAKAASLASLSNGLFDATIGPLTDLWRAARKQGEPPNNAEVQQALKLVCHTGLMLDPMKRVAGLQNLGQSIDLGGIGKGHAGDRFLEVFRQRGITSAYTNLGGNVATLGTKPDGSPWRVGIRHPRKEGALAGVLSVTGKAVVTSGDDQRFFMGRDGKRYHHILDPTTGVPASAGLMSSTVVASSSMDADGLSTLLFLVGLARGIPMLHRFPDAQAVLIDESLTIHITKGLKGCFQATEGFDTEIIAV